MSGRSAKRTFAQIGRAFALLSDVEQGARY
jgi:hypothetical protein